MKAFKLWAIGLLYFLILLSIAVWVRDIPYQEDAFHLTLREFAHTSQFGDPASFATAALDIASNGRVSPNNKWILTLWPPGFILTEAAIVKTLGENAPFIFILQILASALYAWLLTLLFQAFRPHLKDRFAFLLPLTLFMFPMPRIFLLQPAGLRFGESFASALFLIGLVYALFAASNKSTRNALYAGVCLALASYFRSQFELFIWALSGWGVITCAWLYRHDRSPKTLQTIKTIVLIILVAHAVEAPWRIRNFKSARSLAWVHTSTNTFENSVQPDELLEKYHAGFVVAGGGNLVCHIDPSTCGHTENAKKLFFKTFLKHPIEWYSRKIGIIGPYWIAAPDNWSHVSTSPSYFDVLINLVFLGMLAGMTALLLPIQMRKHPTWPFFTWFNLALLSSYFLILTVQQFEVRYFYFLKIYGLIAFILQMTLFLYLRHKNGSRSLAVFFNVENSSSKCKEL